MERHTEQHLKEQGITIESFVHHNGSPYGQYWGYFVAKHNGRGKPILYGKKTSSKQQPIDPFARRKRAVEFALSLTDSIFEEDDYEGIDLHEDPWWLEWIDIGGES